MANHIVLIGLLVACLCEITAAFSAPSSRRHRPSSFHVASSSRHKSTATKDDDEVGEVDVNIAPGRRAILLQTASTASSLLLVTTTAYSRPAYAGIDPAALRALPVEGDVTGSATRLRRIELVNGPRPDDALDIAFETLPSGASYREYRGKGDAIVGNGSRVGVEMTIRCRSFATADEPGGVKYFDTKRDTEFNELAWTIGDGELPPELEECMMGMRRGSVRRIELPSTVVFAARKNQQLPLPMEDNKVGKRRFENLFKTDATLLFEVLVTRIK